MTTLKYSDISVGFKELKGECSLLITISNCGNNCKGCHSPHLQKNVGINVSELYSVISEYSELVSAVCFLGHGNGSQHEEFLDLLRGVRKAFPHLKLGLYSGNDKIELDFMMALDYYKVGSYKEELGGLESPNTNQVMYNMTGDKTTIDLFY